MSFINPISLIPKVYRSSDHQAPQITDNVGDFKSVFKACLVTGYGNKEGAGFGLQDESDSGAYFISQNPMMPMFGIQEGEYDTYFYNSKQEQDHLDLRQDTQGAEWTLVVCELGLYWIVTKNGLSKASYCGLVQSAINDRNQNWVVVHFGTLAQNGWNSAFNIKGYLGTYTDLYMLSSAGTIIADEYKSFSMLSMVSDVFWSSRGTLLGKQPALLLDTKAPNKEVVVGNYQGRPVLSIFIANGIDDYFLQHKSFGIMLYLDKWVY